MVNNAILATFLVGHKGLVGIALASATSTLVYYIISTFYGQIFYKTINSPLKSFLGLLSIIIIVYIGVWTEPTYMNYLILFVILLS